MNDGLPRIEQKPELLSISAEGIIRDETLVMHKGQYIARRMAELHGMEPPI